MGDPVEHSLSPRVHNAGFEDAGVWSDASGVVAGGVYLPLPVPPGYEHFKATVLALLDHARLTLCGVSVTIPHKENLLRLAMEQRAAASKGNAAAPSWDIDEISRACGAANTLVVERDAEGGVRLCRVMNTDAPAAVACLRDVVGDMKGRRVALVGAGGVARGIAAGLLLAGVRVVVAGRTRERAEAMVAAFEAAGLAGEITVVEPGDIGGCDAYVNCTPVGMAGGPAPADSPLDVGTLAAATSGSAPVVMDTVYNPLETPLLRDARAAGFRTIDGLEMFVRQASLQFHAWTGREPAPGLFDKVARDALGAPKKP